MTAEKLDPPFRLVINSGTPEVGSATVPVQWQLDERIIKDDYYPPRYVILIDFEGGIEFFMDYYQQLASDSDRAFRYVERVEDLVSYIQFKKAGKHLLIGLLICGDEEEVVEKAVDEITSMNNKGQYYFKITKWNLEGEIRMAEYDSRFKDVKVYVTSVEIDVPNELFAKKPSPWLWEWVNLLYEKEAINKCEFRKRLFFAFTLQPFIVASLLLLLLAYTLVKGVIISALGLIAFIVLPLIGYVPNLRVFVYAWSFKEFIESKEKDFPGFVLYKEWRLLYKDEKGKKYIPIILVPVIFLPIVGLVVGLVYMFGWIIHLIISGKLPFIASLLFVLMVLMLAGIFLYEISPVSKVKKEEMIRRKKEKQLEKEKRKKEREEKKREEERKWQEEEKVRFKNFLIENASNKTVGIDELKKKLRPTAKLKVSYWTLKSKVCKPYSK